MATIVSFHAHPDDESISVGGFLARAADEGHRVVLVFATRGELGIPVDGVLDDGEQLGHRRTVECYESARILGVERVEFLGYMDSGMMGDATNDQPWVFWQAGVEQAANRLAAILREEETDLLTIYDDHGAYGHPDHIQVHRVGRRAAELAGVPVVVQATHNRDLVRRSAARAAEEGLFAPPPADPAGQEPGDGEIFESVTPPALPDDFGTPEDEITHLVDVAPAMERKRASMRAHASQIGPDHFMSAMPDDMFAVAFGTEWFIVEHLGDSSADPGPADEVLASICTPNPAHVAR